MKEFFKQYALIIGNTICGIAFGFAFYYLFINIYHYTEVRREFIFDYQTDGTVKLMNENIAKIKTNVQKNLGTYNGTLSFNEATKLRPKFEACIEIYESQELKKILSKKSLNIKDVYYLREYYENQIASKCLVTNFIWLSNVDKNYEDEFIFKNKDFNSLILNSLINATSYVKKDIMNNTSYYVSTDASLLNTKNITRDSFYEVLSSYNKSLNYILYLSNWYSDVTKNKEVLTDDQDI